MKVDQKQDLELIKSIKGNPKARSKALRYIYINYYPSIKRLVLRSYGTTSEAEDVFQEGMTALYNNLLTDRFKENSSLSSYLYSICRNIWRMKQRGKMNTEEFTADISDKTDEHHQIVVDNQAIKQMLGKISNDCRKLLVAFYYQQKTMAEIMEMFGLNSVQIAKTKKYRCMTYLVKLVKEKGLNIDDFIIE